MIVILQHRNSKKQRQMPLSEWDNFKNTVSGGSWKVVKHIGYGDMEERGFVPPEISEVGFTKVEFTKPKNVNKRASAKANEDAKK